MPPISTWLLRTFWWALLWLAISCLALIIYIGWIGVVATVVWGLYRLIKGWLALLDGVAPDLLRLIPGSRAKKAG